MKSLVGMQFGKWLVLKQTSPRHWLCRCACGAEKVVFRGNLTSGRSRSCGCTLPEAARVRFTKHGQSKGGRRSRLYGVWHTMHQRCSNARVESFKYYGARGISVCARWAKLENFLADMAATYKPGLQLDRIDVNGNYEPSNCRWVTAKVNRNNRRDSCRNQHQGN